MEAGESLEETVRRELREEVSIEVKDIRYFGSQSWPFPNSLMVGFTAQYASGEICADTNEVAEAAWFRHDAIPRVPPSLSIARKLIDAFIDKHSEHDGEIEPPRRQERQRRNESYLSFLGVLGGSRKG